MIRILFTYVVPLVAPTLLYLAYVSYARKRARAAGDDELPKIESGPFYWSLLIGFVLLIVSLIGLALTTGEEPGEGGYSSPRLEDGKITKPQFK